MQYIIKQGDCLELMKDIPDESIDMICTDPPYLMKYKTHRRHDKSHDFCTEIMNDDNVELIYSFLKESYRVLKDNSAIYVFCNSNKVEVFKDALQKAGFNIKNIIVWVKNNWTAGDLKASFGKQYEFIFLANKGRCCFNGKRLSDVWYFDKVSGKKQLHQNQKPVDLLKQCILKHSYENGVVLDPFMGSGSTGVACINTNRNFIGFELDEKYFDIAKDRLEHNIHKV